ncbi:hypothetical protein AAD001_15075 [Colwelliaceae bacterium 6471]
MKKQLLMIGQFIVLFSISMISVHAKEQQHSPSEIPQSMLQKLEPLTGQWQMQVSMTQDDGKTWQAMPPQTVNLHFTHNAMVLEEKPELKENSGFSMLTYISYDQYRKVFRKAAIDDTWGIMDLYEGDIVNEQLVLNNLKSGTLFPIGPNIWRGFRLKVDLSLKIKNGMAFRQIAIDKTDDYGKTWQPAFVATYEKVVVN